MVQNRQIKMNMEIKVSRNYNTVTIGIQDEPLDNFTDDTLRNNIRARFKVIREEAIRQLNLIGDIEK